MTNVQLFVVQGRPLGKRLLFPPGDYYIGRGAECDIQPDSDWVSRQHCLFRVAEDGVFLRDLGSRNGTLINGRLASGEHRLNNGDRIEIGPMVFEVRLDAPDAPTHASGAVNRDTLVMAPQSTEPALAAQPAEPAAKPASPI